jgi:hypothetical protein
MMTGRHSLPGNHATVYRCHRVARLPAWHIRTRLEVNKTFGRFGKGDNMRRRWPRN